MARVFLVEDNENLREAVSSYLSLNDHEVLEFGRISGVEQALATKKPDLIILDVMLPDGDGFHLARKIRREHTIPIIFLTAKSSEIDRITGFEVGGDDYVVKPFSPKELALRVEAVLRRTASAESAEAGQRRWQYGEQILAIDVAAHKALLDGRQIGLTAAEWNLLRYLSSQSRNGH